MHVLFSAANSVAGAITLNINGRGAKPIYINGTASSASNHTLPAGTYIAFYDGTNYHFRTDGELPWQYHVSLTANVGIPANADLNSTTYLRTGSYACPTTAAVPSIQNKPDDCTIAFMLNVYSPLSGKSTAELTSGNWIYRLQEITTYTGTRKWVRLCSTNGSGVWNYNAWTLVYPYTAGTNVQISASNVISSTNTMRDPATATPLMDGTAAVGSSAKYAREDHVHPSDTTKVDKVTGKGLSTNDFTDALETKLNGIAAGAEVNVQSDWNETDTASDAYIQNKPSIPTNAVTNITRSGLTFTATRADGTTFTFDQQDNDSMPHYSVNESSLASTAGNYTFSGGGAPWAGTDWVGLQVGDNYDKFQLTVNSGNLLLRQNDSGGTNTANWTAWQTLYPNASAIKNITRNGTTFTATRLDGSTFTFTQQDNNSVTGVKGNAESSYRTGNVNLTPANVGAVAKSGDTMTGLLTIKVSGNTGINLENTVANKVSWIYTHTNGHLMLVAGSGGSTTVDLQGNYVNLLVSQRGQVRNQADSAWMPMAASAFNSQSSRRFKENILGITDERARDILAIDVVTYDYKEGIMPESSRFDRTGVIAEDVNEIIPEVVDRDENGMIDSVDYSRFVPYLIRMIQLQEDRINTLEAKVEKYEHLYL